MFIQTFARLRSPSLLEWWEWVRIAGAAGLALLVLFLLAGNVPHPVVVALTLHLVTDFTLQSAETALHKGERGRHLLVHSLAAGGLPLAAAGLVVGGPVTVILWTALGVAGHYAVDWTRKFGLRNEAMGHFLDQVCHIATILVVVLAV